MSKRINLTVTDKQYDLWKKDAEEMGIKFTEYIRRAAEVYFTLRQKKKNVSD